ncbi:hypothetical protein GOP47_0030292 [Adiantum capillus-veneris]|nr:hypothetical protein GOP47_0030292 [Adiantum capillus-veneris]
MAAYGSYEQDGNYRGPHWDTQFDTMNLEAPVRVVRETPRPAVGGEALSAGYVPAGAANVTSAGPPPPPPAAAVPAASRLDAGRMPRALVITSLVLRVAALLALIVAVAVLASDSRSTTDYNSSVSFSTFSSTRYAMAIAIVGAVYSIYETVSISVRLGTGHLLLPGKFSLYISYIGDQIVIALLLTGGSAATATLKDLSNGGVCVELGNFCDQGGGAVAMIFLGFCFLAASLVISSFCIYKNRS